MADILVVDDSEIDRSEIETALKAAGFNVKTADGGNKAIEILKEDPEIRLLIVDIFMPDINGLQLLEIIRNQLKLSDLQVLVASSETSSAIRNSGKALNVYSWILKPMDMEISVHIIKRLLT